MKENKDPSQSLLIVEAYQNYVVLKINRPAKRNALNAHLRHEILQFLNSDFPQEVVVLLGEGKAFCAGLDLKEQPGPEDVQEFMSILGLIYNSQKVFVAAVNGAARGGGVMLINACDFAISVESATFGLPAVMLEESIDSFSQAEKLTFDQQSTSWQEWMGCEFTAIDCIEKGLINQLLTDGSLLEETQHFIQQLVMSAVLSKKKLKNKEVFTNAFISKSVVI